MNLQNYYFLSNSRCKVSHIMIQTLRDQIWTVLNALLMQSKHATKHVYWFLLINLIIWMATILAIHIKHFTSRYLLLIALLFMTKFVVLTHFNQLILSITIQNPYKLIDELKHLEERPGIQPKLFMSTFQLNLIRVNNNLSKHLKRN